MVNSLLQLCFFFRLTITRLKDYDMTWLYGPAIIGSNTSPKGFKSAGSILVNKNEFTVPLRAREIKHVRFNTQVMQAISVDLGEEDVEVDSLDNGDHEDTTRRLISEGSGDIYSLTIGQRMVILPPTTLTLQT